MYEKDYQTQRAPGAIGPYVQGVDLGSWSSPPGKFRFAHRPVRSRLIARSGAFKPRKRQSDRGCCRVSVGDIIKMTVFITDLNDFAPSMKSISSSSMNIRRPTRPGLCAGRAFAERCEAGN